MLFFDHFDFLAPIYDNLFRAERPDYLIELAVLPTKGRLLDAGGGTGRIAYALRDYANQIVVADLSLGMLKKAAGKNALQPACACTERLSALLLLMPCIMFLTQRRLALNYGGCLNQAVGS